MLADDDRAVRGSRFCAARKHRVRRLTFIEQLDPKTWKCFLYLFVDGFRIAEIDRLLEAVAGADREDTYAERFQLAHGLGDLVLGESQNFSDLLSQVKLAVGQCSKQREAGGTHARNRGKEPGNTSIAKRFPAPAPATRENVTCRLCRFSASLDCAHELAEICRPETTLDLVRRWCW
jgi:hypothetical protein